MREGGIKVWDVRREVGTKGDRGRDENRSSKQKEELDTI